jgi:hypothetical protein
MELAAHRHRRQNLPKMSEYFLRQVYRWRDDPVKKGLVNWRTDPVSRIIWRSVLG